MLKDDTLGANLLKWVTPPVKLLNRGYPGVWLFWDFFRKKGLRSVGGAKLLKLALPGVGAKLLKKRGGPLKSSYPGCLLAFSWSVRATCRFG